MSEIDLYSKNRIQLFYYSLNELINELICILIYEYID
jgi:hypothetical protein